MTWLPGPAMLDARMQLDFEQTLTPYFGAQQSMKVSPRLVAANYILELSSQELQQAIATELHVNAETVRLWLRWSNFVTV